ncbi:GlxA family transcriptional regulator [Mesorhizobium sp. RMAD-H1]|uniref:GlxA family transcriptional regulator n=1 Tax=Mesorhizobium sp. RMAD-H1 TaxID=2587065 RepID=UPI00161839BC|nr:GlxA family transcriptional regulator [Mesorhizobium sp. RMAD-H1]MBB2970342.1 transcriptional regulator GlxA family with amidase domain [Mesorhizobium sp. RMAD-H1]
MNSEASPLFLPDPKALDVTVLIFSGASLMCVASTIDPMRAANRVSGGTLFRWRIVSLDGQPAITTCGLPIAVSGSFDASEKADMLLVVGGFGAADIARTTFTAHLRRAVHNYRMIGGIEAGSWLLGRAGLLSGRKATTHWEDMEEFTAAFPESDVRPDRYVIDGPVFTSGGASPTFDLMLHLIRSRFGMSVALDVASVFIYDEAHASSDAQPLVSLGRLDDVHPKLAVAIRLMESHIDAPLTVAAIARRCGLSARSLEKIFLKAVGEGPGRYYLRLRLKMARRLITDTKSPLADIAARTGFSSAAAFTRTFRQFEGRPPSALRASNR